MNRLPPGTRVYRVERLEGVVVGRLDEEQDRVLVRWFPHAEAEWVDVSALRLVTPDD